MSVAAPEREAVYTPQGKMTQAFDHRDRELLLVGSTGTGKTLAALWKLHLFCWKYPGVRTLMVRKTLVALTGSSMVAYQEYVLGSRPDNYGVRPFGGSKIRPAGFTYPNGSTISIGGMDKADKIKSTEYEMIYINEATELQLNDYEMLITRRHRNPKSPYTQILSDCNPDSPAHWLYQRINNGQVKSITTTHEDNPVLFDEQSHEWTRIGKDYIAGLDELTGVRLQRLRYGIWAAAEGIVYDEWNPEIHLLTDDQLREFHVWKHGAVNRAAVRTVLAGVDWGYTAPGHIGVWAFDRDGRAYLLEQVHRTQRTMDWWIPVAKSLRSKYSIDEFVCDPAEPGFIEQFNAAGLPAVAGPNAIRDGINAVKQRLKVAGDGRPRLYVRLDSLQDVDQSLKKLGKPTGFVDEITSYVWADGKELPVDDGNHACLVAGTMVRTAAGEYPIESFMPGDSVTTRDGERRTIFAGMTDFDAEIYRVTLSNGATLRGTANHPVYARNRGFVPIDSLRYADILVSWDEQQINQSKPSSSTALHSVATRWQRAIRSACTTRRRSTLRSKALGACMRKSGSSTTGRYHQGTKSTIRTSTPATTIHQTSIASRLQNIGLYTRRALPNVGDNRTGSNISNVSDRLPLHGMGAQRAKRGTQHKQVHRSKPVRHINACAISAVVRTSRNPSAGISAFARTSARLHGVVLLASMTKYAFALGAGRRSLSTDTAKSHVVPVHVLAVEREDQRQPVYNLSVVGAPEYFANGVLVHNCDPARYVMLYMDGADDAVLRVGGWR